MNETLTALRAIGEETRLRILVLCAAGELSVTDFTHILGQSQPRVSRHLKLLVEAGLLARFREGAHAYFRLREDGPAAALLAPVLGLLPRSDPTLEADRRRLAEIRRQRETEAARYFSENAVHWDRLRSLHIDDSEIETVLRSLVPAAGVASLLDIGTGTGRILQVLADRAGHALGIDQSREMLALARANLAAAGLTHCELRQGDMYRLDLPDAQFDLVTIHQVLHYAEDPEAAIGEAARVLKPGGLLLIVDFAPHELVRLQREHAHRHLGFAESQVAGWLRQAGLAADPATHLPGDRLTVTIWRGRRPALSHHRGAPAQARGQEILS